MAFPVRRLLAAMSDMVCVAISAFFAKFCNKWVA